MGIDILINKVLFVLLLCVSFLWIIYYGFQIYKGFTKKEFTIISGIFGPSLTVFGKAAMVWASIFSVITIGVLLFFVSVLKIALSLFF